MDTKSTLSAYLQSYCAGDIIPMHMPGHKRKVPRQIAELMKDIYGMDVTEVPQTDDLHDAHGIIAESMMHAAKVYNTRRSIYLVCGSTCGNLAAIHSVVNGRSDVILMCEDSHRSVYHALETTGARGIELHREVLDDTGMQGSIDPNQVSEQLRADREHHIRAVHITSPTYDGVLSDIRSIADIIHEYDIPLIVDEAHGAHLPYIRKALDGQTDEGRGAYRHACASAIECGADIVVQSLHKTLPSLTQTSIMHVCSERIDDERLDHALDIYETSSPSYILMASIDACIRYMEAEGLQDMKDYVGRIEKLRSACDTLSTMKIWKPTKQMISSASVYDYDYGKLVIYGEGQTGTDLSERLRDRYKIETERTTDRYVLGMSSAWDSDADYDRLTAALSEMDKDYKG